MTVISTCTRRSVLSSHNPRKAPCTSEQIRTAYTKEYYLTDCGGYETYGLYQGKQLDLRLDWMARLASFYQAPGAWRVLDLGCGRGEMARHFAGLGHQVDAIDYAPDAIALAEGCFAGEPALREQVRLLCASVTDPAVYQGPYDLALASDLIEHLAPAELEQLYHQVASHLRPGGAFIIHTYPNLWYYRYGYPKRRRRAAIQGEHLPVEPRSAFELQMHINEQSPRIMRRQLARYFPYVVLWAGDHVHPARALLERFRKSDWHEAPSLFAIAAHQPVAPEHIVQALQTPITPIKSDETTAPVYNSSTRWQKIRRIFAKLA